MDEAYVENVLDNHGWQGIPITVHRTFASPMVLPSAQIGLLVEQKQVIDEIGNSGKNCVIVGRNADILLEKYAPFNIFVCADMQTKVQRCIERAKEGEDTTAKEIEKQIRRVDKNRSRTREILSSSVWGQRDAYHLIVNTTGWEIKDLSPAVANFAKSWFEHK